MVDLNEAMRVVMSEMGKRGGKARAKSLTAERRREIAHKAARAAAKAHKKRAQERRKAAQK